MKPWAFWAVLALGALVYLPALNAFFVADDHLILRRMQEQGLFGIASTPGTLFFRPLTSALYYLDYRLWGLNPLPYHLVSLGWHLVCMVLVFRLAVRWLMGRGHPPEQSGWVGLGAMALFGMLPAHTEAVVWIASRADLTACALGLASLLCLLSASERGKWNLYDLLAWLLFGLGLVAKESIALLPLIALILLGGSGFQRWGRALALVGVLFAYMVVRTVVIQGVGGYPEGMQALQQPYRLGVHLAGYGLQMVSPTVLFSFLRDGVDTTLIALTVLGWLLWGWGLLKARGTLPKGWGLWFGVVLLALVPVLAFQPALGHPLNSRYTYLASAFGVIGWAMVGYSLWRVPTARYGMLLLVGVYAVGSWRMASSWHTAGEIARSTLQSLLEASPSEPVWLISIPDHYRGAYIWRTSLGDAIALFAPEVRQPVTSLSRFTLRLRPEVAIEYRNGVAQLSSPEDLFLKPEGDTAYAEWQSAVRKMEGNRLELAENFAEGRMLWSFSEGRFVPVR